MKIEIIRSSRKTMVLEVTEEGRVIVRASMGMPQAEVERFVQKKSQWIERSLEEMQRRKQENRDLEKLSMEEIRRLSDEALKVFPEKTAFFAKKIGVTYGKITIRNQKSRWGSCSAKGNLNYNCILMLAPEEVQDYVVVHELCHRKEMNHSERFWNEVEKILPDYKERRAWLKEHGNALIERMIQ